MVELTEPPALILTIKKRRFVRAVILQVGSGVESKIRAGDDVTIFNEGTEIHHGTRTARIIGEAAVVMVHNSVNV